MEIGCLFHSINTGIKDNEKILQINSRLFEFNEGDYIVKNKKNMTIDIGEKILPSVTSYSGITNEWLKNYSEIVDEKTAYTYISKLFSTMNKHIIYLIGWNIEKQSLEIIEKEYNRITGKELPTNNLYIIDVKRLISVSVPVEEIGNYNLNTAYLYCINDLNQYYKDNEKKKQENYCLESNDEIFYVLKCMMEKNNLVTLRDVYDFINEPRIIENMPFGKYINKPIEWIVKHDEGYTRWLLSDKVFESLDHDLQFTISALVNRY